MDSGSVSCDHRVGPPGHTTEMIDGYDLLIMLGLLLVGLAVWLVAGWPGVLGYGGAVCLALGLVGAVRGKRGPIQ